MNMNNEFTKWFLLCVQNKYADFNGRARRKEYWMYVLVYIILNCIVGFIGGLLGLPFLTGIFCLALLAPSLAVGVRRLHDVGKSGWWLLIGLVPVLGILYLLYLAAQDSQPSTNAWGANPKTDTLV